MKYKCSICGHVYDEEKEGVKFADLPAEWVCPICKQPKAKFEPVDETAELVWASEHKIGIASDQHDRHDGHAGNNDAVSGSCCRTPVRRRSAGDSDCG